MPRPETTVRLKVTAEDMSDTPGFDRLRKEYLAAMLGYEPNEESVEQLKVFEEALLIHAERTKSYGVVWREYGSRSPLLSAAKKMARLMKTFWDGRGHTVDGKAQVDDAYDLLNYTAFFVRLHEEENA